MELLDGDAEYSTKKYKIFKNVLDGEVQMISWLDFSNAKLVRGIFFFKLGFSKALKNVFHLLLL